MRPLHRRAQAVHQRLPPLVLLRGFSWHAEQAQRLQYCDPDVRAEEQTIGLTSTVSHRRILFALTQHLAWPQWPLQSQSSDSEASAGTSFSGCCVDVPSAAFGEVCEEEGGAGDGRAAETAPSAEEGVADETDEMQASDERCAHA